MLSDSVEAAARTVSEPTDERFRDLIRQIASRAILDGQFDRCDLTFRDLDQISERLRADAGKHLSSPDRLSDVHLRGRGTAADGAGERPGSRRTGSDGPA
jgi:hypothetical protein